MAKPATKPAKQSEQLVKPEPIVLQAGLALEDLTKEIAPFMESVNQQMESEDDAALEAATKSAQDSVGTIMSPANALAARDRVAEVYFAFLDLAARIRKAVQQAEAMARRQERFAEIIRSNIEAWMLTSWDAKRITGNYREFRITKNPDKVMVIDEALIPTEYFDEVPATKVLNKTRLAETLKAGMEVPGAILETNRTRLDIK